MQKQLLTGSLDEQCEFLYQLALEKIADGNYTGASHALKEIAKHAPDYKDVATLLVHVNEKKSEHRKLLISAICGAILFTGLGTALQLPNDLWFLLLIGIGTLVGYGIGTLLFKPKKSIENNL